MYFIFLYTLGAFKQQQSRKKKRTTRVHKKMQSWEVEHRVYLQLSHALVRIINYLCWAPIGKEISNMLNNHQQWQYFIPSLDALLMVVSKINQINLIGITAHIFFPAYMSLELCKTECEHNLKFYLVECRRLNLRPERFAKLSGVSLDDA